MAMDSTCTYKQLWLTNMLQLGLKPAAIEEQLKVSINEDMFNHINKKGSEIILHFLLSNLEPQLAKQRFRDCWPIYDKKQEQEFRKTCVSWVGDIAKEHTNSQLPRLCASLLLSPGGDRYYIFIYNLSKHALLMGTLSLADQNDVFVSSFLRNGVQDIVHKDVAIAAMKAHIVRNQQETVQRLSLQAELNKKWKATASCLVREYQSECKEETHLKKQLQSVSEEQKSRLTKGGEGACGSTDERTLTLSSKVTDIQRPGRMDKTREMWGQLEGFEERGERYREVVASVLEGGDNRCTVDARDIQIHVPDALMPDYEKLVRSGKMSPLYQDGQLNLVSVLTLYCCALKKFRVICRLTGLPDFDAEKMEMLLTQQRTLLASLNQMRTRLDVLQASHTVSISKWLAKLEKIKSQTTPTACVFYSGRPPLLAIPKIEFPPLELLPPTPEPRTRPHPHDHTHKLDLMPRAGRELSTPEAVHNISQSVHRAASKTADIGKPMRSKVPVLCPVSNKQPTQKALHKCAKLKKAIPSTTHDSLANTPKLSSSRFVKPPARSLAKDPVRTNPAKSLPSSTVYDKLADQIAEMVSSQSEEQMLLDPSPVASLEELHCVTDTEAALGTSAFVSKDCITRTPLTKSKPSRTASLESPLATGVATNSPQVATPIYRSLTTAVSFQTTPTAALLSVQTPPDIYNMTPDDITTCDISPTPRRNFVDPTTSGTTQKGEDLMSFATPLKHPDVPHHNLISFLTPAAHPSTPVLPDNTWIVDIEPPTPCPDDFTLA